METLIIIAVVVFFAVMWYRSKKISNSEETSEDNTQIVKPKNESKTKRFISVIAVIAVLFVSYDLYNGDKSDDVSYTPDQHNSSVQNQQNNTQTVQSISDWEITYNNLETWVSSIGTIRYQGIVEITNTGEEDLYLSSGRFDIENPDGSLFASRSYIDVYPQIISPGEKAYYYSAGTLDEGDISVDYKINAKIDAVKSKKSKIILPHSEFRITDAKYSGIKAIGRIENNTGSELSWIEVAVICFDQNGYPVEILHSYADDLKPGDICGCEATSLISREGLTAEDIASYKVFVWENQLQFN
jgi:hypothetical protein